MLIGIDGNEANTKNRVGVGQFAFKVLENLYKIDKLNTYYIYLKEKPLSDLPLESKNWSYKIFGPKKLWTKFALPMKLFTQKEKLDLFYSPSHYTPSFSPFPLIPTIHDLGYLQYRDQFTKKDLYQLINWTKKSIQNAKKIIAVSNFTKNEIIKTYNVNKDKINVAYNGVDDVADIKLQDENSTLSKFNIESKKYYLYLGTLKPNKNISFLINAFSKIKNDNKMVIAGKKGWLFNDIFETVKSTNTTEKVIFTDYISETEKWVLYKNAICLIMPTLYEGFGIPVIEAQKMNIPVIASDIPILKEIMGDSAIYIDPTKEKTLIEAIQKIEKSTINSNKDLNKFTWANTAKSILETFNQV